MWRKEGQPEKEKRGKGDTQNNYHDSRKKCVSPVQQTKDNSVSLGKESSLEEKVNRSRPNLRKKPILYRCRHRMQNSSQIPEVAVERPISQSLNGLEHRRQKKDSATKVHSSKGSDYYIAVTA